MQSTVTQMIPIKLIDTAPQVRRSMDKTRLEELADDIRAHGLLQPIVVRACGDRFRVIAGHRRRFACEMAGLDSLPVVLMEHDLGDDTELQLVENLQREDLSDDDIGLALSDLYEKHASLDTVALMVNKSKSWVSKRIKLATNLHWFVRELFEDGITEDGDFLCVLSNLVNLLPYEEGRKVCDQVRNGTMDRETAREALAKLKADRAAAAEPKKGKKPAGEKKPRPRSLSALAGDMQWKHDRTALQVYESWMEKEQAAFVDAVLLAWHQGADMKDNAIELASAAATYEKRPFNLARWMGYLTKDGDEFLLAEYFDNVDKLFARNPDAAAIEDNEENDE